MNPSLGHLSQRGLYVVCFVAALIVCGIAVGLRLSVPEEITAYVANGLMLPAFRYGLLFPLIACGILLSTDYRPIELVVLLAVLATALWFGIWRAEALILLSEPLVELILKYPIVTLGMALTSGVGLLLPLRARRWFTPFVCAICGLAIGLYIIMESPADYYYGWFASAAGLGCMAVVIVSIVLADGVRRLCVGSGFAVAGRIFGSWLIAASLMLTGLAIVPQRPSGSTGSALVPTAALDDIEMSQQPFVQRFFDASSVPPVKERQVGDVIITPVGGMFLWTGQDWEPAN